MQPVLLKIYGNISPATQMLFNILDKIATQAMPMPELPVLKLSNELLTISFEGIWFPVDESVDTIRAHLTPAQKGKLDIIDIETWTLTRYVIRNGSILHSSAPLNNVLSYSGH